MRKRSNPLIPAGVLAALLTSLTSSWAQLPPSMPAPRPAPAVEEKHTPQVGEKAPDFSLPDQYGLPVTLSEQWKAPAPGPQEGEIAEPWVLLVFYRGYWCPHCNSDLRALQNHLEEFSARGVHVVAVSTDPMAVTRKHTRERGFTFTFLADPNAEVVRKYALLREGEGLRRDDVARPVRFLIDSSGIIRWMSADDDHSSARLEPEEILAALDRFGRTAPATPPPSTPQGAGGVDTRAPASL